MSGRRFRWWGLAGAIALAVLLAPFASSLPDGLEWAAQTLGFAGKESHPLLQAPFADYSVPALAHGRISTGLAGVMGTVVVFGLGWLIGRWLQTKGQRR